MLLQDERNGAAPAHIRNEVRRKRGIDNDAAEVVKLHK
jgi:hypothetical protein